MTDKTVSLIYIDKGKIWFYVGTTGEVATLDFPVTVVKDMEVLNRDLFTKQFESFLSVHKVPVGRVDIVISSSLLFVKDLSGIEPAKQNEAVKEFLENVPFDNTAKVTTHQDNVFRIIACNKDLFILMKRALEKNKFVVPFVLPALAFPNLNIQTALDAPTAQFIVGNAENAKSFNFIESPLLTPLQNITANAAAKDHPKRLPLLLGAFGGLVSILIGVIVVTNNEPTVTSSQARAPRAAATPTVRQSSASATLQSLRVSVIHGSTSTPSAQLATALRTAGVNEVETIVQDVNTIDTNQVVFSQTVPLSLQQQISEVIRTVVPSFTSRVVTGLGRDVEIRLSQ